jgi:carboxymethylenebutenolidase
LQLKGKHMGTMIELQSADGTRVPAYEARPAGTPKGAVVVIQEIFGVNSHIRAVADGYAAEGYLAVAPAAFHRVKPGVELGYTDADMGEGFGYKTAAEALHAPGVMQDIQAAIDHAAQALLGRLADLACGLHFVGPECGGTLLRWRRDHRSGNLPSASRACHGAFCR